MKERLRELVHNSASGSAARNLAREFLQALILGALQRAGAMVPLAFQGGTALRFLYSTRRYSEDLAFALARAEVGYDFRSFLEAIQADLRRDGCVIDLARVSDQRAVHSAFVRFPGLLHELGLSSHRDEALSVKLEVDTHPQARCWKRRLFGGMFSCVSSITTARRSWPGSCTRSCKDPIPRVATSTI